MASRLLFLIVILSYDVCDGSKTTAGREIHNCSYIILYRARGEYGSTMMCQFGSSLKDTLANFVTLISCLGALDTQIWHWKIILLKKCSGSELDPVRQSCGNASELCTRIGDFRRTYSTNIAVIHFHESGQAARCRRSEEDRHCPYPAMKVTDGVLTRKKAILLMAEGTEFLPGLVNTRVDCKPFISGTAILLVSLNNHLKHSSSVHIHKECGRTKHRNSLNDVHKECQRTINVNRFIYHVHSIEGTLHTCEIINATRVVLSSFLRILDLSPRDPCVSQQIPKQSLKTKICHGTSCASRQQNRTMYNTSFIDVASVHSFPLVRTILTQLSDHKALVKLDSSSPVLDRCIFELIILMVIVCSFRSYLLDKYGNKKKVMFPYHEENYSEIGREEFSSKVGVCSSPKTYTWSERRILHDTIHHQWRLSHPAKPYGTSLVSEHHGQAVKCQCPSANCRPACENAQHPLSSDVYQRSKVNDVTKSYSADGSLARLANQTTVQVCPVSQFLPDATCNPDIDLAHVGYRLATLSALPASMPVSRIRLADAGFYFWGRNDEVRCYSCRAQHSGWTKDDNPLEVHRRLSPDCTHLRERDEELLAGSSGTGSVTPSTRDSNRPLGVSTGESNRPVGVSTGESNRPLGVSTGESNRPVGVSTGESNRIPRTSTGDSNRSPRAVAGLSRNTSTPGAPPGPPRSNSSVVSWPSDAREGRTSRTQGASPDTETTHNRPVNGANHNVGSQLSEETEYRFPRARLNLNGAVYPMYQDMASRRRSFGTWDERRAPPLDQVILCGMFYAGYADCVRCFYCGVGLKNWEVTDDVWQEHVRWRPGCQYLVAIKGDSFIRETQRALGIETSGSSGENGASGHDYSVPAAQQRQSTNPSPNTTPTALYDTTAIVTTATVGAHASSSMPSTMTNQPLPAAGPAPVSRMATSRSSSSMASASGERRDMVHAGRASQSLPTFGSSSSGNGQSVVGTVESGARESGVTIIPGADRERMEHLQAENQALAERLQCRACHSAAVNTILMPCGHLILCESCAGSVTSCPLCSQTIRATARVYME